MPILAQTDLSRETLPTMCDLPNEEIAESALPVEQEPQPAEQEYQRVELLVEMLRRLGQDPDSSG
jgi:hypothetical protein